MCGAFVGCSCMAFHDVGRLSGGFPERWAEIEMGRAVPSGLGGFVASHEDSMAVPEEWEDRKMLTVPMMRPRPEWGVTESGRQRHRDD